MATRKIIDIEQNGKKVWPKGHAKATFMSDGRNVEEAINQIATGGGGITAETDPIFSASPAVSITEEKKAEWDNKVDKVSGKQLSTEDFTSALKTKLEGLSNYDDTELSNAISTLRGDFDKLVSGDTTTAIKTFNEIIAFLDGIQDSQDLSSIIASIEQQIAAKQDKITDLDAIRSGAEKGATALQSYTEQYKGTITGVTIEASNGLAGGGTVSADTGSTDGTIKIRGVAATNKGGLGMSVLYSGDLKDKTYQDGAAAAAAHTHSQYLTGVTINGTTKNPTSGIVDLGTVITAHQTLKTINGESIVGSGNITISGGGSGSSSGSGAYPEVDGSIYKQEDYSDNYYSTDLTPNTFYVFPECGTLDVFLGPQMAGIANEYIFQFTSGSEPTSLILPSDIKWANDEAPVIESNKIYQISILNGLASVLEFNIKTTITFYCYRDDLGITYTFEAEAGMTWTEWVNSPYNIDKYYIEGNYVRRNDQWLVDNVLPTDTIISQTYNLYYDD